MQQLQTAPIDTPAALRITGANQLNWHQAMGKGLFLTAPATVNPSKRHWDDDHLMCLRWWDSLCTGGMPRPLAGQMAAELMKALTSHPEIEVFYVYTWADPDGEKGHMAIGTMPPDEAPNARVIADLPVAKWRNEIKAAIANHFRRKAARNAKRR